MRSWTELELAGMTESDDRKVAPCRDDGVTTGTLTRVWSVVVDGGLYARAYHGTACRWYTAALQQGAGQMEVGGQKLSAVFRIENLAPVKEIDAAYKKKYSASS